MALDCESNLCKKYMLNKQNTKHHFLKFCVLIN